MSSLGEQRLFVRRPPVRLGIGPAEAMASSSTGDGRRGVNGSRFGSGLCNCIPDLLDGHNGHDDADVGFALDGPKARLAITSNLDHQVYSLDERDLFLPVRDFARRGEGGRVGPYNLNCP